VVHLFIQIPMKFPTRATADNVMAACALIAVAVAIIQIISSNRNDRAIEAATAYREYLSLAIEHTELANGLQDGHISKAKYQWYVSYLLNSAEQIATSSAYDEEWRQTLLAQLCLHRAYLGSKLFESQRFHYAQSVREFLDLLPHRCD